MDEKTRQLHLEAGRQSGRDATCGTKVDYRSEESAVRAAEAMNAKSETRKVLEAYPCYFCLGWHIGRAMSEEELAEFQPLRVDSTRQHLHGTTGIYVPALTLGEEGVETSADIAELDTDSLLRFLRSKGGENEWAEGVVLALLGHAPYVRDAEVG